jgi:hypothetical protein
MTLKDDKENGILYPPILVYYNILGNTKGENNIA